MSDILKLESNLYFLDLYHSLKNKLERVKSNYD